jgi:hypothetical protein
MCWNKLELVVKELYAKYNLCEELKSDLRYLESAYSEIEELWNIQFDQISNIKCVLISEAPLWGLNKKYFYNEKITQSQFYYASDLDKIYDQQITSKKQLIQAFNHLGIIILDISPFPFNPNITALNYRRNYPLSKKISFLDYNKIITETSEYHLLRKFNLILIKSNNLKFLFRYARVKKFNKILKGIFNKADITFNRKTFDIWQKGGGVNRELLKLALFDRD